MSNAGAFGSGILVINGDSGSVTGPIVTITGGTSGAIFTGVGTTLTESFNFLALPATSSSAVGYISIGGTPAFHTFGTDNTFVGSDSGNFTMTGINNSFVGAHSGNNITSGNNNSGIGLSVLTNLTSGSNNNGVGNEALANATSAVTNNVVGSGGFIALGSGAGNVGIGHSVGSAYTGAESNNILFTNPGVVGESDTIRVGTQGSHTRYFAAGVTGVTVSNQQIVTIDSSTGQLGAAATLNPIVEVTGTSQALVAGTTYIANNGSLVTLTLPATATIGDKFEILGKGAGLFKVAQNASQVINFLSAVTTTGVAGSITSTQQYQSIIIRCITANTQFTVEEASGASWTVV